MRRRLLVAVLGCFLVAAPALGAECNGDECQGPPPAPEEVIPGTAVVDGPPNPPVRFPESGGAKVHRAGKGKGKGRHRHGGRGEAR